MVNNVYYIPKYHKLVKVLSQEDNMLTLSGMCNFYNDVHTCLARQIISIKSLNRLNPVLVESNKVLSYDFMGTGKHVPTPCVNGEDRNFLIFIPQRPIKTWIEPNPESDMLDTYEPYRDWHGRPYF